MAHALQGISKHHKKPVEHKEAAYEKEVVDGPGNNISIDFLAQHKPNELLFEDKDDHPAGSAIQKLNRRRAQYTLPHSIKAPRPIVLSHIRGDCHAHALHGHSKELPDLFARRLRRDRCRPKRVNRPLHRKGSKRRHGVFKPHWQPNRAQVLRVFGRPCCSRLVKANLRHTRKGPPAIKDDRKYRSYNVSQSRAHNTQTTHKDEKQIGRNVYGAGHHKEDKRAPRISHRTQNRSGVVIEQRCGYPGKHNPNIACRHIKEFLWGSHCDQQRPGCKNRRQRKH